MAGEEEEESIEEKDDGRAKSARRKTSKQLHRRVQDKAVQAVIVLASSAAQSDWRGPTNASTQWAPRTIEEEVKRDQEAFEREREELQRRAKARPPQTHDQAVGPEPEDDLPEARDRQREVTLVLPSLLPLMEEAVRENNLLNLYRDDFAALKKKEGLHFSGTKQSQVSCLLAHVFFSFTRLIFSHSCSHLHSCETYSPSSTWDLRKTLLSRVSIGIRTTTTRWWLHMRARDPLRRGCKSRRPLARATS
jgi:hypothetical protein